MDSYNSTVYGKAYEYACILALKEIITQYRTVEIIENESFKIAKERYEKEISVQNREEMLLSAKSGTMAIIDMEPRIIEVGKEPITISLQPDTVATRLGDIRDILIIRRAIEWEIGISVKHNHSALKHSRLSPHIDFGRIWADSSCSETYFNEIEPIFTKLKKYKEKGLNWRDLDDKESSVYVPILNAFKKEFKALNEKKNITANIVKYLIGCNGLDYYKLIHNNHSTTIMPFNIFGTLNQSAKETKPKTNVPKIKLPTRIIE